MDFAWVVDALRRGLKVTREAWKGDPPMYLYMYKTCNGRGIMMCTGTKKDFDWYPTADQMLTVTDWEEYVEPKKVAPAKSTQEDIPVWPEVNADGYSRMSKDSDVLVHDGVYRRKREPAAEYISLSEKETRLPNNPSYDDDMQYSHGGKPVEEPDFDAETNKAIALVARNIAENLVELLRNPSVQRILQGNANTNQDKED